MKNFTLLILAAAIFIIPQSAYSQESGTMKEKLQNFKSGSVITKSATQTIGSPYLTDNFIKGHLKLSNGRQTDDIFIRYDTEENIVQFLRDGDIFETDASKLKGFTLNAEPENIYFANGYDTEVKDIEPDSFLRVAYAGKLKLLVHHKAVLHEDLASYSSATQKNKYRSYEKYYLVTPDNKFHRIKSGKSDVLNAFNEPDKIEKFADENDLSFEDESELITIIKHVETTGGM